MTINPEGRRMNFILRIKCDNAAFREDDGTAEHGPATLSEIARILRAAAKEIEDGGPGGQLQDANGNTVGEFALHP